jgi:signal transduction histidine kinase
MKKLLKLLLIYSSIGITFFLLFTALFHTSLFSQQPILLYRGLNILWTVTAIYILYGFYLFTIKKHVIETYIAAVVIAASLTLVFFVLVPVTVDRSVTTFLLTTLTEKHVSCSEGATQTELTSDFINKYVVQNGAIERRLDEQQRTATIEPMDQCWKLTPKGKKLVDFFNTIPLYFGSSYEEGR